MTRPRHGDQTFRNQEVGGSSPRRSTTLGACTVAWGTHWARFCEAFRRLLRWAAKVMRWRGGVSVVAEQPPQHIELVGREAAVTAVKPAMDEAGPLLRE